MVAVIVFLRVRLLMENSHEGAEKHKGPGLRQPPHCLPYSLVLEQLSTDADDGLSSIEARSRLDTYGYNRLDEGEGVSIWKILLRQIANAMMLVSSAPMTCLTGLVQYSGKVHVLF